MLGKENIHVLSADMNKAKAFSIDKKKAVVEAGEIANIPALITDVYYSHEEGYFQLQVFFNKNIVLNKETNRIVDCFVFQYNNFDELFIDWLYCLDCIKKEEFDFYKHHAIKAYASEAPLIELREEEKGATMVERDGKRYLIIRTEPENGPVAFMSHMSFRKVEGSKE